MKQLLRFILTCCLVSCTNNTTTENEASPSQPVFYTGMDLSFQSELENYNINYKDADQNTISFLDFVKQKGTNLVRLKLWHTPQNGQNSLADVTAYAKRVKAKNMDVLLNIHYSDFWADPGTQTPPQAWQNLSFEALKIEVFNYTATVVETLKSENALPNIIQIGNETDSGFLWNYGRVWNNYADNWNNYADLINTAITAIKSVDTANSIKIMLHHSNIENAQFYFEALQHYNLNFDIMGLSYYPQFHTKNINTVSNRLEFLTSTFNKPVLMVEIAYPFTLSWNDNLTNFIGSNTQILSEFEATPEGQKAYLQWLSTTLKNLPNHKGLGFCYWAPDWVAFPGNANTSTNGSAWENQCLFDFNLNALPALDVFNNN